MNKYKRLKNLLEGNNLTFIMEAHNALSAKIAENNGFEALWASGLSISATLGLPDRNVVSWSQLLNIIEYMVDATSVPILMDGDSGFGNFNNVRHIVNKASQKQVAGICLEDKLFPKQNSFLGERQTLASISEFTGKIKAACDSRVDDDFCIVARTEALVSGVSMAEALERASAYADAGADAVLIHSKKADALEVFSFSQQWDARRPLLAVPTKYYKTPSNEFIRAGITNVIWANHSLRSAVLAIDNITKQIKYNSSVEAINSDIATLESIFAYTNEAEVQQAEKKYMNLL